MTTLAEDRYTAIHLLRAGHSTTEVAKQLKHTARWVRKWHQRFVQEGWSGLEERSRIPHTSGRRLPERLRQAVVQARSELEAEAARSDRLKYIGGPAVRTRLKAKEEPCLPSVPTIERILREKGLTRQKSAKAQPEVTYPHLRPSQSQQLCQVDIVPHFLTGGEAVACFNALDVVSRYPTSQAYSRRRAQDATRFLRHVWQTIGIAHYTQVDNEACFCGGFTHPYVLGQVVRAALLVGTELVFSPVRHPQSNCFVERFHQDYNRHVWQDTYLENREAVQQQADLFLGLYRQSGHHCALHGQSPDMVHQQPVPRRLAADVHWPEGRIPLCAGRVHFLRRGTADGMIDVLNVAWSVPKPADTGVWATVEIAETGATLSIYDAAPDQPERICLIQHPFPLSEAVHQREAILGELDGEPLVQADQAKDDSRSARDTPVQRSASAPLSEVDQGGATAIRTAFHRIAHLTSQICGTMY